MAANTIHMLLEHTQPCLLGYVKVDWLIQSHKLVLSCIPQAWLSHPQRESGLQTAVQNLGESFLKGVMSLSLALGARIDQLNSGRNVMSSLGAPLLWQTHGMYLADVQIVQALRLQGEICM